MTTTAAPRITSLVCAYCHELASPDASPKCRGSRRSGHRWDEITMDPRLAEILRLTGMHTQAKIVTEADARPNFWWGFDLPGEGIRFATEYATADENVDMLVFDGADPEHSILRYRVSFQAETPLSVIIAAAAEAMSER